MNVVDDTNEGFRPKEQNVLYVGEGVTVKGELSVPDVAVIDGTVEGHVNARFVRIGPSGSIQGNVMATDAEVYGRVMEKLEVKQHLLLRSSGRIDGEVSYGELEIEKGAVISGTCVSTDFRADKKQAKPDLGQSKVEKLKLYNKLASERVAEPMVQRTGPVVDRT